MLIVNNEDLVASIRSRYTVEDVDRLSSLLRHAGTFDFPSFPNGLFPASLVTAATAYTGYHRVWVRDNVHVAHALHATGSDSEAVKNVTTLAAFFRHHGQRFHDMVEGRVAADDTRSRPPIRFRAETLDADGQWAHAQNDALGYFLWLYCRLALAKVLQPSEIAWDVLSLFPAYLHAISYWRDEDSGHWEETPKISASSIGTVVAGLRQLLDLARAGGNLMIPSEWRAALAPDLL